MTQRVVRAVARETGRDPLDLPPLYGVIDGDSLDAYIERIDYGDLSFAYAGVTVTVYATGTVQITDSTVPVEQPNTDGSLAAD